MLQIPSCHCRTPGTYLWLNPWPRMTDNRKAYLPISRAKGPLQPAMQWMWTLHVMRLSLGEIGVLSPSCPKGKQSSGGIVPTCSMLSVTFRWLEVSPITRCDCPLY